MMAADRRGVMPHDAESATEYVALEPTVGRSVLLPANMRVSSFCALIAAVSTLILCLGLRTSSDALLPNAQLQAEPSAAPLLCYEFAATVFKRTTLVGDREKLTSSEMRAIHVSRLGDYVGLLDPPTAPFQKKFRAFWTADRAASASDQSCVALHIMPFFDESICEVQPAKHLNTSVEPSVGCSTRALKRVMPLDASFGKAASSAYVYAKQVSVASDARTTTGGELLQWEAPAMSIDVTEDGVEYSAHMSTRVSYHVSHNSALLSDECVAHAAGKAPRAALLAIESHVSMTIECKSTRPRAPPPAAASLKPPSLSRRRASRHRQKARRARRGMLVSRRPLRIVWIRDWPARWPAVAAVAPRSASIAAAVGAEAAAAVAAPDGMRQVGTWPLAALSVKATQTVHRLGWRLQRISSGM